jgi:predicted nucleotidyltransferase
MVNILFEDKGRNYQVPGLPYEQNYNFVRPLILDGIPTVAELRQLLESSDRDTLTNPWSVSVMKGFRDYIPTTFRRATQGMPRRMLEDLFDADEGAYPEEAKVLLQLQTEIEAKAATIDAAIIHHKRELGTVVNKAHLLNRIYMIGRIYGHLQERSYPFTFGDLTDESTWDDALSAMKLQFMGYLTEIPQGNRRHGKKIRQSDVTDYEATHKFVYLDWLHERLGDDLLGVLVYGSSARCDDPAGYSDFDNWVRVKDVQRAHKLLGGTCPVVYEGRVVNGKEIKLSNGDYPKGAKPIGIHLFPESEEYTLRHIKFLHDSREFLMHTRVIYGEFPFIKVKQDEVVERGISQAYIKLKTIAGSLNWAYSSPEKIQKKPNLFEFIVKNVRFFLQHSLNATEGPRLRNKDELTHLLGQRGIVIPEYRDDLGHIQDSLLGAMVNVLTLQREFIEQGRQPNLTFLTESRKLEWDEPDIDDWGKVDLVDHAS